MKIKQTFGFFIGVAIGVFGCQMVNSFRQKAVMRLDSLNSVYTLAAVYCKQQDFFLVAANSMLDGLIIGTEEYGRFLTSEEKLRKQKLYEGVFRLRQVHPPEKSENKDFQWFQDQANSILEKNREKTIDTEPNKSD